MTNDKQLTVADIRADKDLGRGSCSIYDECYTDAELQGELNKLHTYLGTSAKVLKHLKSINREALNRMLHPENYGY